MINKGIKSLKVLLPYLCLCLFSAGVYAQSVQLRTAPNVAQGQYVKAVLDKAYENIGYVTDYVDIPGTRELKMASQGQLTAALARDSIVELSYPSLIRVPIPLFSYQVVLVADRRVCGFCLDADLKQLMYPRGGKIYEQLLKRYSEEVELLPVNGDTRVSEMLEKGRISAALIADFRVSEAIKNNPHFIVRVVETRNDYHYLSNAHSDLLEPLTKSLQQMQSSGELKDLRHKYSVKEYSLNKTLIRNKIVAASGTWKNYTNDDGTGVYWQIIDSAFGDQVSVEKNSSTWLRAVRLFESKKADVLVGAYLNDPKGYLHSSYHLDYEYELLALALDKNVLATFSQASRSLIVCVPEVFDLTFYNMQPVHQVYIGNTDKCNELFKKRKVDVVINYEYNLYELYDSFPSEVFYQSEPLFVMFHNSELGRQLKEIFDSNMKNLAESNQLKAIFPAVKDYKRAKVRM